MKNYYEILEVNEKASEDIIKKVYKIKIKKNHPDLFQGSERLKAEETTKELTEAYDVLSSIEKRKNYDDELQKDNLNKKDDNYLNIISSLKSENEYLKGVLAKKNNLIETFFKENYDDYAKESYIINQNFEDTLSDDVYNNSTENSNKNTYYHSMVSDLKQFIYKFVILLIILLTALAIFSVLTGNSLLKILFGI